MRNVKELLERLNSSLSFEEKYPELQDKAEKVHVLYVAPCMNASGYYRMIAPALDLNKTKSHKAIVNQIHKWNFNKKHDEYDTPVDERLIRWADYIVFPAFFIDIQPIIEGIVSINDRIQFVMDIDCHYFNFPDYHPGIKKYPKEQLDKLLENLSKMDVITAPTNGILEAIEDKLEEAFPDADPMFAFLPNLLSNQAYAEVPQINKNNGKTIRLGIITNPSQSEDVKSILPVLQDVLKDHNAELFIFGWNGKLKDENSLGDLPFKFVKPVSFLEYPTKLNKLALDVILHPMKNHPFNTEGKSFVKYLEAAAFAIPMISSSVFPYSEIIKHGENGMLAKDENEWKEQLQKLITDTQLRTDIGREALKYAWKNWSNNKSTMDIYKELFI